MDAREAMRVPARLAWEEAAATPLVFLVVYDMLVAQGHLAAGQWLLVTGVSSGVGVAALQTGKALGAKVIGTSGSAEKLARLEKAGLDVGIRTRTGDFHDAVMKATDGKGVNLVVNNVGGSVFAECIKSLGFEGRLAIVGHMDRTMSATLDLEALHGKRLTVFGVSNRLRNAGQRAETVRGFVRDVMPKLEDGSLRPWSTRSSPSTTCRPPSPSWSPTPRSARSSCACDDAAGLLGRSAWRRPTSSRDESGDQLAPTTLTAIIPAVVAATGGDNRGKWSQPRGPSATRGGWLCTLLAEVSPPVRYCSSPSPFRVVPPRPAGRGRLEPQRDRGRCPVPRRSARSSRSSPWPSSPTWARPAPMSGT